MLVHEARIKCYNIQVKPRISPLPAEPPQAGGSMADHVAVAARPEAGEYLLADRASPECHVVNRQPRSSTVPRGSTGGAMLHKLAISGIVAPTITNKLLLP